MRIALAAGALFVCAAAASAQQPVKPDTTARADSAKAAADSVALMREIEKAQAQQPAAAPAQAPAPTPTGSTNPRLLPDFSAVGDLVGDLTPKSSTQDDASRFGVREVELAVQAAVDPYFRGDVFLGLNDLEKVSIEQAFLTTTALPYSLQLMLGRYLMPIGKLNTTHRHDLHTIEYPYVVQRFLSPDGLKGTGIQASKIMAPFGFYQELIFTAVDQFGEPVDSLRPLEPVNKSLRGLGISGRLRNYWDLTQNANLELSFSGATGKKAQLISAPTEELVNAIGVRQSLVGTDLTYRWRPLQQGLYKSFILQAEVMRQFNESNPKIPAELTGAQLAESLGDYWGTYVFARYQIAQRAFLGARYDWLQDPTLLNNDVPGATLQAVSGYWEFYPSEFSKINIGYEHTMPESGDVLNRLLVQASFSLGPHKPHPF